MGKQASSEGGLLHAELPALPCGWGLGPGLGCVVGRAAIHCCTGQKGCGGQALTTPCQMPRHPWGALTVIMTEFQVAEKTSVLLLPL